MSPNLAPGSGSGSGEGDKVVVSAYNGSRFPAVGKRERRAEGRREGGEREGRKEGCAFRGALAKNESGEREREDRGTVEIRAPHAAQSSTMHVAPTLHLPQNCHSLLGSRHECKVAA